MTHVSLFTGIGGLDLAAEWAGFETVFQVECDPYCLKVLEKHWPDVPRVTDIREVTSERVRKIVADAISERCREARETEGRSWISGCSTSRTIAETIDVDGSVTVISGGFPCQPFSQAGKRRGQDDDRYLWPQMLRVIRELSPAYVVAENVSGLLSLNDGAEFETVCTDLEREGYEVLPFHYPAASVGAPHKRDRVFIVGHAMCSDAIRGVTGTSSRARVGMAVDRLVQAGRDKEEQFLDASSEAVAERNESRPQGYWRHDERTDEWLAWKGRRPLAEIWQSEPNVGRVAYGVPSRVDRLKALGNAVVPQQAYPIFAAIARMEASHE